MQYVGSQATISSVAISTSTFEIMPANENRKYGIIHNASGQEVLIAFDEDATTSEGGYTVKLADGSAYEVTGVFKGAINGIVASGIGNLSVTVVE